MISNGRLTIPTVMPRMPKMSFTNKIISGKPIINAPISKSNFNISNSLYHYYTYIKPNCQIY